MVMLCYINLLETNSLYIKIMGNFQILNLKFLDAFSANRYKIM